MKKEEPWNRRGFLKKTGGVLITLAAQGSSERAFSAESEPRPAKRDPAQFRRLLEEMESRGSRFWSVPRKDGEFLNLMVKATRARQVLELGTSHGYSAIWIGLGLEETNGRLITIEIDVERHDLARRHVAEAALSERVTLIRGDAHRELARLEGPFDFVFMDADKEGQVDYFNQLYPKKLVPGGLLAVHNAIRQASSMQDYLNLIRRHSDFDTVILSATMDDGFCVNYRHRT